jgi:hypothetical protein
MTILRAGSRELVTSRGGARMGVSWDTLRPPGSHTPRASCWDGGEFAMLEECLGWCRIARAGVSCSSVARRRSGRRCCRGGVVTRLAARHVSCRVGPTRLSRRDRDLRECQYPRLRLFDGSVGVTSAPVAMRAALPRRRGESSEADLNARQRPLRATRGGYSAVLGGGPSSSWCGTTSTGRFA